MVESKAEVEFQYGGH